MWLLLWWLEVNGVMFYKRSLWPEPDNWIFFLVLGYFSVLMTNPWGSLSFPTPAPLTAAMVIQYFFPGLRADISNTWWLLSTVQFWKSCCSDSTHHTWVEKLFTKCLLCHCVNISRHYLVALYNAIVCFMWRGLPAEVDGVILLMVHS